MGQYLCTGHCHLWSRLPSTMRATFLPLLLFIGEAAGASSAVHSISPTSISEGGGVIFIYGHGFSADNFNFNDPILGNKIWFYNDFETIPCASPVKKNWLLQNPQAPSTTGEPPFFVILTTGTVPPEMRSPPLVVSSPRM